MEIFKLEIEKIKINPNNKDIYGDIANDKLQDLMASMSLEGQLEAITINQNFEIISGTRRYEAAKQLGWKTIDAIQIEVNSDEEPIQMVNRNITREKKASVILKEYDTLIKKYGSHQGHRTDLERPSSERIEKSCKRNSRKFVSEMLNVSEGTLNKLKRIAEEQPELIKEIDAGKKSINGAANYIKSFSWSMLGKRGVIHSKTYEIDNRYVDAIIQMFLELIKENKNVNDFSLYDLLEKAMSFYEHNIDVHIQMEVMQMSTLFDEIQDAIKREEFEVFGHKNGVLTPMTLDEFYLEAHIPDKTNIMMHYKIRDVIIKHLLSTQTGEPYSWDVVIKIKNDTINLKSYQKLGEYIYKYFDLHSTIYNAKYEFDSTYPTMEQGKYLKYRLTQAFQELRPLIRILFERAIPSEKTEVVG